MRGSRQFGSEVLTGNGMLHEFHETALRAHSPEDNAITAPEQSAGQGEVSRLLSVIAGQIAEADRRHCEALDEMKARLQQLGSDARGARPQVPQEFVPAFSRIEDALSQLAERISEARAERSAAQSTHAPDTANSDAMLAASNSAPAPAHQSPMPLRSSASASTTPGYSWAADFSRNRTEQFATDPFDIIDNGGSSKSSDLWTMGEAEALTRVYEEDAAAPQPTAALALVPSEPEPPAIELPPMVEHEECLDASALLESLPEPVLDRQSHDRQWMEERFAGLAQRLQESMDDKPVHDMLAALDDRLMQLEQHLGLSLEDVAKRSDVEGLKLVEAHIEEISRHLEQTQGQLGRLDGIEAQLNEVVEHLAAQFESRSSAPAMQAGEYQRIAEEAAQSVATRFAGSMTAGDTGVHDDQIASVRGLLESYIGERRDGDEHNALMLDTMQQALIRVLDRIDAMEQAQVKAIYQPVPAAYQPQSAPAAMVERQRDAEPMYQEPEMDSVSYQYAAAAVAVAEGNGHPASGQVAEAMPYMADENPALLAAPRAAVNVAAPAAAEAAPRSEPRSMVEKLRQDFVADAQRAKLRAATVQAEQVAGANPDAPAGRGRGSVLGASGSTAQKGRVGALSPKLIIAALALFAILGAGGMWMMGSATPEPIADGAPGVSSTPAPAAAIPAPANTAVAKPQTAAPKGAAPQAEPGANGGFEFDTDPAGEPVPVPKKISTDPLEDSLPGIRLRQSAEPVSPMNLAILQHQQNMANLSSQLGETAANTLTPASFMKEVPISAVPAVANAAPVQTGAAPAEARSSALVLPPVTVGPLSLRLAAAKGDASAEFEAASRLAEGKGTSQNFKEALRWYQRSASQGFAQAQYRLGTLYERGLGIKADTGIARSWYQRAAEQGNVKAMHNLAVLSASRQSGSPDYETAAKWFRAAADRDLQDSQFNLGVLYESGLGVVKDTKQAMKWYSLAARSGDAESVRRRDLIKSQLAEADLVDVAGTVAGFQPVTIEDPLINDARAAGEDWKKRMGDEAQG